MINYLPKRTSILVEMAKKGFNQKTLSEAAGVNRTILSLFLNGRKAISSVTAKKIADALESEVTELFIIQIDGIKQEV